MPIVQLLVCAVLTGLSDEGDGMFKPIHGFLMFSSLANLVFFFALLKPAIGSLQEDLEDRYEMACIIKRSLCMLNNGPLVDNYAWLDMNIFYEQLSES